MRGLFFDLVKDDLPEVEGKSANADDLPEVRERVRMLWLGCYPAIAPFYAEGIPKMNVLGLSLGEVGPGMWMERRPFGSQEFCRCELEWQAWY